MIQNGHGQSHTVHGLYFWFCGGGNLGHDPQKVQYFSQERDGYVRSFQSIHQYRNDVQGLGGVVVLVRHDAAQKVSSVLQNHGRSGMVAHGFNDVADSRGHHIGRDGPDIAAAVSQYTTNFFQQRHFIGVHH